MSITTVMFDLDGTLLPMDYDDFTKGYFKFLAAKLMPHGYEPKSLIDSIWAGTKAMVMNDGTRSNEEAFWAKFATIHGEKGLIDRPLFEEFYSVDFQKAQAFCGFNPKAAEIVHFLKDHGIRVILATNPIFPSYATESRTRWAGLEPSDFELVTTYENIGWCKPNPEYYREILHRQNLTGEECIMVGNDVIEDLAAEKAGIKTFLITDCLINKENKDISACPHGDFDALRDYLCAEIGL